MVNPQVVNQDSRPLFFDDQVGRLKTVAQEVAGIILQGTILGVITASLKLAITKSGNADGSQIPRYVALSDIDAQAGDVDIEVASWGKVNQEKLVFDGADTLDTLFSGQTYFDWLRQSGILAVITTNLDELDNQ